MRGAHMPQIFTAVGANFIFDGAKNTFHVNIVYGGYGFYAGIFFNNGFGVIASPNNTTAISRLLVFAELTFPYPEISLDMMIPRMVFQSTAVSGKKLPGGFNTRPTPATYFNNFNRAVFPMGVLVKGAVSSVSGDDGFKVSFAVMRGFAAGFAYAVFNSLMNRFAAALADATGNLRMGAFFLYIMAFHTGIAIKVMIIANFSGFCFGKTGIYRAAYALFLYAHYAYGIVVMLIDLDIFGYFHRFKDSAVIIVVDNIAASCAFIVLLLGPRGIEAPIMNGFAAP